MAFLLCDPGWYVHKNLTFRINGMTILSKREAHINWSMVTCKMVAVPVTATTLRTTGPRPADSRQ